MSLFTAGVEEVKTKIRAFIVGANHTGKIVYIYGSSTRGLTILQFLDLDNFYLPKAVERNPLKVGLQVAGLGIPIISEEQARAERPDYMLVLPYFYIDEFVKREVNWLQQGGQFIVPLPEPRLIGSRRVVFL